MRFPEGAYLEFGVFRRLCGCRRRFLIDERLPVGMSSRGFQQSGERVVDVLAKGDIFRMKRRETDVTMKQRHAIHHFQILIQLGQGLRPIEYFRHR